ncbi:hypothetical protein [Nonomuraea bangladeshensis]|uniref:hypothetical protein n=1 Tax=Nonomuraea bangladeshensis TaxID=404385 RepID=UPI003C2FDB68
MADYDLPDDLIAAQKAFYAAEARCQELVDAEPAATAVVALEAEISDEQRRALADAREQRLQLVETLHRHPFWATVDTSDRIKVQAALRKAARAGDQAPPAA